MRECGNAGMWECGRGVRGQARRRFKDLASTYVLRPRLKNLVSFNLEVREEVKGESDIEVETLITN